MTLAPYYEDEQVQLFHGDAAELLPAVAASAAFVVTDPPYGVRYRRSANNASRSVSFSGIAGDEDTSLRDAVLALVPGFPSVVFGSPYCPPPSCVTQVLVWQKWGAAGVVGCVTGFRRDVELIYLRGTFPFRTARWSSVLTARRPTRLYGHAHEKPVDLMARLCDLAPGTILDPFAGSGSTLVAAKNLGRRAIGIELEERFCEAAARRLSQEVLFVEGV